MKNKILRLVRNFFMNLWHIIKHKFWVIVYTFKFAGVLVARGFAHDFSKLGKTEMKGFVNVIDRLDKVEYGSADYKFFLGQIRPSIEHHYKLNKHHVQYFKDGINGMSLIDIVEMVCDWQAMQHKKKIDMTELVTKNKKRFQLEKQMESILLNTVAEK